jgi:hypothetical protein
MRRNVPVHASAPHHEPLILIVVVVAATAAVVTEVGPNGQMPRSWNGVAWKRIEK